MLPDRGMLRRLFSRTQPDPPVGGLYVYRDGDEYGVLKVLAVDEAGIHTRMYSNRFPEAPTAPPDGPPDAGRWPRRRTR